MATLLSMRNIHKSFSGIPVLRGVRFDLDPGEVHVLAGENGAGKTTLINILAGVHTDYSGTIEIDGRVTRLNSPHDAARKGISAIHQELSLVGPLSVADNIFLGREVAARFGKCLFVNYARQEARAAELCSQLGLEIDVRRAVDEFAIPVQTRIEIAKGLAFNARVLVLDEPTSALSAPEVDNLFQLVAGLKRRGTGIIYITHRMDEIYRVADRITVLRDGRWIGTSPAAQLPESELIHWMIGSHLSDRSASERAEAGRELLRVENFCVVSPGQDRSRAARWLVRDACFSLSAGEVLGIAGLQGSGASALLSGLFGVCPDAVSGAVHLEGRPFTIRSPRHSIKDGIAYLGPDRKGCGLIFSLDLAQNISLPSIERFSRRGFLEERLERDAAGRQIAALNIRGARLAGNVGSLSGGNQQKVLLARWAQTAPKVLLLDEPTRGIDVGAKQEIYSLIERWRAEGMGIVLITSELQELIRLADRILVMCRGRITAVFERRQAGQDIILRAAMGATCSN